MDRASRGQGLPFERLRQKRASLAGFQADPRCHHRDRHPQGHALRGQQPDHEKDSCRGRQAQAYEAQRRSRLPHSRELLGRGDRGDGSLVDRCHARTHQCFRRRSRLALRAPERRWSLVERVLRRAWRQVES